MLLILILFVQLINGIKINNKFIEEPDDVETIIGSTLIFRCRTEPIHQSQITWCKNDFCTLGKTRDLPFYPRYQIIGNADKGEHHFQIVNVSLEDIGMYQCQIRAGQQTAGAMSRKAKLTVLQIPTSLLIDSPVILIEHVLSFIVCRANNAMPEAKISWHFPKSISYISKNDYALLSGQALRNSISNLTLIANRSYHGILIQCQAHSSAIQTLNKTMITQQYIQTIFRPEINIILIGKQIENNIIYIQCNVECRPNLIKIQWFNGTSLLNITNENRLSLLLTRYMNKNKITCQAINQVGTTNQSIILDIIYKPIFIDTYRNQLNNSSITLVNEGESIELECHVDSSPSSLITWIFNEEIILFNQTSLKIDYVQSMQHIGLYICSAHHSLFGTFNRTIRLGLKGPPEMIEEKTVDSVYIGQSVTFICSISNDIPIQVSTNQYGSSLTQFKLRVNHLKDFFIRRTILFGSILIGLFISFILIIIALINHYKQNKHKRIKKKSSTTDETISSSLAKQQENIQHDYQDETNSINDQTFIHEKLLNNQIRNYIYDSPQHDLFYSRYDLKRYSTVV
ncbi:unnamed protein product [Rotaria magnacalcarata]|uniref:Ig-like domain-containing protein n=1 Tax=Rotaria magnacalcarata TaxID=392030 RepID=A0A816DAP8_9BILA|nr:unnamed protein product [Rotaria magnacalcarata]